MSVYISHSTSPWELAHVYLLAEKAAQQRLEPFVPDRQWNPVEDVPKRILDQLYRADSLVLFATSFGQHLEWVNRELQHYPQNRPVVALVESGITLQGIPSENIVFFDRNELGEAIYQLTNYLQKLRLDKENRQKLAALAVGGLLFLLFLATRRQGDS